MINKDKLDQITDFLKENVFRNDDIMLNNNIPIVGKGITEDAISMDDLTAFDLIDVIASLHNLLYEVITGKRYNYMFHWANKCGGWCFDDIFDNFLIGDGETK